MFLLGGVVRVCVRARVHDCVVCVRVCRGKLSYPKSSDTLPRQDS